MTVTSPEAARVQMSVQFSGEVAQTLTENPDLLKQVCDTFTNRTGVTPQVTKSANKVELTASVDYAHLASSGAVTGVSGLTLSGHGHDVRAQVSLRDVPDLLSAINSGTASQADSAALAATMAQTTLLQVRVEFPGGLSGKPEVNGVDASAVRTDSHSVTIVRSADHAAGGTVLVSGDPAATTNWPWLAAGAFGIALGVGLTVARRRDSADPRTANL